MIKKQNAVLKAAKSKVKKVTGGKRVLRKDLSKNKASNIPVNPAMAK